ncbi:MAG TPA: exonuclease SbcCD subunit D [Clostridia bacterium]|nr:exonuclease SbcCD subunit D [Clostridia bacterium]
MKILHTADLHLGKSLNERSLIDLQKEMLEGLIEAVKKHKIELVLLAGDIYDRSLPPKEAVELLSLFLSKLCREMGVKVVMIPGNHDSSERIAYAADLLWGMGLYIGLVGKEITKIEIDDVDIYGLPYVDQFKLNYFHEKRFANLEEAMAHHLSSISLDPDKFNIMMTHHYVLGKNPLLESDSERPLFLGKTENLSTALFNQFDYVALGHIHTAQQVADNIYYSGSPMKYSKSEAGKTPGYYVIDTQKNLVDFHALSLSKDIRVFTGFFNDLMQGSSPDLSYFELEDRSYIPDAMNRLRQSYPEALGLSYTKMESNLITKSGEDLGRLDHLSLFKSFYLESTGNELTKEESKIVVEMLERSSRETD